MILNQSAPYLGPLYTNLGVQSLLMYELALIQTRKAVRIIQEHIEESLY